MMDRSQRRGRQRRRVAAIASLLAFASVAASDGRATEYTAARKAGRGLAAMTTGFLEVPGNMVAETRHSGLAQGLTLGFVKGLGGIVMRELVGVYELVSAPIAAPDGYRPLIQPEFPWSYFDETQELADTRRPDSARSAEPCGPEAAIAVNAWGAPVTIGVE
jgi:putative exosortase-associated protein (TIGR04073 family)